MSSNPISKYSWQIKANSTFIWTCVSKFYSSILLVFLSCICTTSTAQTLQENLPVTNGTVFAIVRDGNTIYLGGDFNFVGLNSTYGSALDITTGIPNLAFAKPNGKVETSVADGSGGWYIGGHFTSVGGVTRNGLARINADGSLNNWNPDANNIVYSLAISGGTVYAGGDFTIIGGQTRNRLASIDATTGAINAWNPDANNIVYNLSVVTPVYKVVVYYPLLTLTILKREVPLLDIHSNNITWARLV